MNEIDLFERCRIRACCFSHDGVLCDLVVIRLQGSWHRGHSLPVLRETYLYRRARPLPRHLVAASCYARAADLHCIWNLDRVRDVPCHCAEREYQNQDRENCEV